MRATLEAPSRAPDPMIPGRGLLMVQRDLYDQEMRSTPVTRKRRVRRVLTSRAFAWTAALILVAGAAAAAAVGILDARGDADRLAAELTAVRADAAASEEAAAAATGRNAGLQTRISRLQERVADLEAAKVRTVVETETVTVTETVTRWVPDGKDVTVELTGFEGLVKIHDVQLTHSFGYSDLIGIAVNRSGEVISYAQLGCSFLDEDGRLLASGIDNKQGWQPGQSWGFVCSADVDATGGILRVDEMS
jgi:hypothetical protein